MKLHGPSQIHVRTTNDPRRRSVTERVAEATPHSPGAPYADARPGQRVDVEPRLVGPDEIVVRQADGSVSRTTREADGIVGALLGVDATVTRNSDGTESRTTREADGILGALLGVDAVVTRNSDGSESRTTTYEDLWGNTVHETRHSDGNTTRTECHTDWLFGNEVCETS